MDLGDGFGPIAVVSFPNGASKRIMEFVGIWTDERGDIMAVVRPRDGGAMGLEVLHYSRVWFAPDFREAFEYLLQGG